MKRGSSSLLSMSQSEKTIDLADVESLFTWALNNGAEAPDLYPEISPNGLGACLVSSKDRKDFSGLLLSIPFSLVLSEEVALDSELGNQLRRTGIRSTTSIFFAYLIWSKFNPKSKFHLYCKSLPNSFTTPLYWSADELAILEGTALSESVEINRTSLRNELDDLSRKIESTDVVSEEILSLKERLNWENILWAFSVLLSRGFPPKLVGSKGRGILLPMADLLNHKYRTRIAWESTVPFTPNGHLKSKILFTVSAPGLDINAGDEIFNNYGSKSNGEWLLGYGFCEKENMHDIFLLPVFQKEKIGAPLDFLNESGLFLYYDHTDHKVIIPEEFIDSIRSELQFPIEEDMNYYCKNHNAILRFDNEIEVICALKTYFWGKLRRIYSCEPFEVVSKYEIDVLKIEGTEISHNLRNALLYRVGQAKLLFGALESLEASLFSRMETLKNTEGFSKILNTNSGHMATLDEFWNLEKISLEKNHCNFNVVAKETIQAGEILLRIPLDSCLTFSPRKSEDIPSVELLELLLKSPEILEKFDPTIKNLDSVLFWSGSSLLDELPISQLIEEVDEGVENMISELGNCFESKTDVNRASIFVERNSIDLFLDPQSLNRTSILLPLHILPAHSFVPNCFFDVDFESNNLLLKSCVSIDPGMVVSCALYRAADNASLLLKTGDCLETNPYEFLELDLEEDETMLLGSWTSDTLELSTSALPEYRRILDETENKLNLCKLTAQDSASSAEFSSRALKYYQCQLEMLCKFQPRISSIDV